MTTAASTQCATAREKLLAAADELFYAEGIQTVGIDRIIEHAGVAKASLYNIFGSKDELVRAYLEARHTGTMERLGQAIDAETDPRDRLLSLFRVQAEIFREPGFRGCAFNAASAEAPDGGSVALASDLFRADIRGLFRRLAKEAGARNPAALAAQLHVIYDGAAVAARMDHTAAVAKAAMAAATAVIDAALGD